LSDPCDLSVIRDGDVVRIVASDGPKTLTVLEITLPDFAKLLLGDGPVMAAIEKTP